MLSFIWFTEPLYNAKQEKDIAKSGKLVVEVKLFGFI
jgi:hypothetical protein